MGTVSRGSYGTQQRATVHCNSGPHRSPLHHLNVAAPVAISSKPAARCSIINSAGFAISGVRVPHASPASTTRKSRRRASLSVKAGPTNPQPDGDDDESKDSPPAKKTAKRKQRHAQLDTHPTLTRQQVMMLVLAALSVCTVAHIIRHPESPAEALASTGSCFAGAWLGLRPHVLEFERERRGLLFREKELADDRSRFSNVEEINVHYTAEHPPADAPAMASSTTGVALYHGLGANVHTWEECQAPLAAQLNAIVTAHDMTGFGLTERVPRVSAYSLKSNGRLGRGVLKAELEAAASDGVESNLLNVISATGRRRGRMVIGHSVGAFAAAHEAIADPENVSTLVLVAPAIPAWPPMPRMDAAAATGLTEGDTTVSTLRIMKGVWRTQNRALKVGTVCIRTALTAAVLSILQIAEPFWIQGLWGAVRSPWLWKWLLANAWHRKDGVTDDLVDNYRFAQLVKGWEAGVLYFLRALISPDQPFGVQLEALFQGYEALTLMEQLSAVVARHDIKVLIIHGTGDKLVPIQNSRILVQRIPNAVLKELDACGHNPQEEKPDEVTEAITAFQHRHDQ